MGLRRGGGRRGGGGGVGVGVKSQASRGREKKRRVSPEPRREEKREEMHPAACGAAGHARQHMLVASKIGCVHSDAPRSVCVCVLVWGLGVWSSFTYLPVCCVRGGPSCYSCS